MGYAVHVQTRPEVTGQDSTVYVLEDGAGGRAEVWPALGFNCYRWQAVRGGATPDLLHAGPGACSTAGPAPTAPGSRGRSAARSTTRPAAPCGPPTTRFG